MVNENNIIKLCLMYKREEDWEYIISYQIIELKRVEWIIKLKELVMKTKSYERGNNLEKDINQVILNNMNNYLNRVNNFISNWMHTGFDLLFQGFITK